MDFETGGLSLRGLTVLVVEDDATLRTLVVDIMATLGAECIAFDNAEDALVNLLEHQGTCSLLIADHGVPGSIKGMELVSMVKEKWPDVAAILTSGFSLDTRELDPASVYLFKPWSLDQLLAAISKALPASGSFSSGSLETR